MTDLKFHLPNQHAQDKGPDFVRVLPVMKRHNSKIMTRLISGWLCEASKLLKGLQHRKERKRNRETEIYKHHINKRL